MARPQVTLSEAQRAELETLAALLSQDQIADYFGISRSTFHALCHRDPDVLERYKRGKARAIAHVANGLLQKARSGCKTSMIFYLKTQAGWRETAEIHHRPAGPPLEDLTDAELFARFAEMRDKVDAMEAEGNALVLIPNVSDERG